MKRPLSATTTLDKEIKTQQEAVVGAGQWTYDNSILVTQSTKETTDWKLNFIQQANHSVEISGSICGGHVFREALKAIEQRIQANPQFQAHVLSTNDLLEKEDKKLIQEFKKAYPLNFHCLQTSADIDSHLYRRENHVKVLIVDEKYYILGGTNYQDRLSEESARNQPPNNCLDYLLGTGSSDMDVVGRGKTMSQTLRREFFKLYALLEQKKENLPQLKNHYTPVASNYLRPKATILAFDHHENVDHRVKVKALVSGAETKQNVHVKEMARLIEKSDKTVTVAQMYFHPQKEIAQALKKKVLSQVPVKVLTASSSLKAPLANQFYVYANQRYTAKLLRTSDKVKISAYNNGKNIFHKKVAVFEKQDKPAQTVIGSFNWGGKSHKDYELSLAIKNDNVAKKVLHVIDQDHLKSSPIIRVNPISRLAGFFQHIVFPHLIG
ncbi:MAG: phosphatidylserine/phosphatidylglycerophosphate/cardiolipin synthase family protein [Parachlamydia sp.]|nr:phosphatidylserine/phosphatidylglycerophosphate/cardiolipin synthase family protein [Parachlamydia sp.]